MSWLKKLFKRKTICEKHGHVWDTTNPAKQRCKIEGCTFERNLYYNRFPKIGEPQVNWEIIDWSEFYNMKLK
jgi:hypothetical protein